MYSPQYNQIENREELLAFMRANDFALLVTCAGGELHASHLPVLIEERGGKLVLVMHMAKANSQWQQFYEGEMSDEVMVVFTGPHAYVSPRWYEQKERVPTWNYAAVHAYGRVKVVEGREAKYAAQAKLVRRHDPLWESDFSKLSTEYRNDMLDGIVNFEIELTRLETRWKLSQNRGRREQERIIAELERSAGSAERALAALTRKHLAAE